MALQITDDDWRRIRYAGRILGGVTGTAAGVAGLSVALLMRQAADARRIIPVAEAPPPRGDGLYGAKFPGTPLSMVVLGDSTGAGYGVHRPRETPGARTASCAASDRLRTAADGGRTSSLSTAITVGIITATARAYPSTDG